jgi:hypothetical protein
LSAANTSGLQLGPPPPIANPAATEVFFELKIARTLAAIAIAPLAVFAHAPSCSGRGRLPTATRDRSPTS